MTIEDASASRNHLVFAYYVSGHGFGHATRVVEVVRHLILAGHDVHVVTGAPDFVFTTEIQSPRLFLRKLVLDCGAVQADALTVDRLASLEKYSETVVHRASILATEVGWLKSINADLVVTDVVAVACRAAADAGIRSVCVGNFSWDFIYAEYVTAVGYHHKSIITQIAEDYSHCELLIRLPGYCPMPAFRDVIDVPLVVRRLHKSRKKAVLSRLGKDAEILDENELHSHQKLQDLYNSTRETKHFQKDIVRAVEGFISIGKKQKQIDKRFADDCCKYETENANTGFPLVKVALELSTSRNSIEDKRETMLETLNHQVSEPLKASIRSASLEDARHLARSCGRLRQEVETQAMEVLRRQTKVKDPSPESALKLKNMEVRLSELRSSMVTLQKEAISAMLSVEEQQQQITFRKLLTIVDVERAYHHDVLAILEELHAEMILAMQMQESAQTAAKNDIIVPSGEVSVDNENRDYDYFIGKVIHPFDAQADGELSLTVDDYVIVRQVSPNGWSEGECNGKIGWFPSAYIERQEVKET